MLNLVLSIFNEKTHPGSPGSADLKTDFHRDSGQIEENIRYLLSQTAVC